MEAVTRRLMDWGFEDLIEVFEDHGIDDEAFSLLETDSIKELIPAIGPRVKFLKAFKAFCQVDQPVPNKDVEAATERPTRCIAPEILLEMEAGEVLRVSTSEDHEAQKEMMPRLNEHPFANLSVPYHQVLPTSISEDEAQKEVMPPHKKQMLCRFDIHGILSRVPNGSSFLQKLLEKRSANAHDRKVICQALVYHLMEHHGTNPPAYVKVCLAESLVEQLAFLKDREGITGYEAWYIKGKKGSPARGSLEARLRYIRRKGLPPKKKVQPHKIVPSPTTCPKLLQQCHQPIETVLSDEAEEKLIDLMKNSQNTGDIVALMKQTAKNRHAWIRISKANVAEILARYPHLLQPEIVEQDFELTISKDASKRFLIEWPRMAQKILEYVKNVEVPRNWVEKLGCPVEIDVLSEGEQQALALNVLPFLFSGRSSTMRGKCTPDQALRSFIDWKAEGTDVDSIINQEHPQSHPFVLLIGGSRWKPLQSYAVVEQRTVACPSIVAAVDFVFKLIFVLNMDYQPHCMAVWQFLEGLVYRLGGSVTAASILRFRTWLSQQ